MNKKIVVVVPLHEYNETVKDLLKNALLSVPEEYNVIVSTVKTLHDEHYEELTTLFSSVRTDGSISLMYNESNENSDFCTLVNNIAELDFEWFSILEYDDTFNKNWFSNVEKYMEYKSDVSVFLPLTELINFSNKEFIGYGNEAPWASSFSEEIGYIDNECIEQYFDFYMTGGVYNTKDFRDVGGLKPSIKLTFWYEFLLRITNNSKKVYVIPKLGYNHNLNRENSLYDYYQKNVTEEEGQFWLELAKQDYFYKSERSKDKYIFEK